MDDELMLDEELEGDIGSDFEGDGECFPSEWTVVDDADDDEFVEMSAAENSSGKTNNDDSISKKEKQPPPKESSEKKLDESSEPQKKEESREKSQDAKFQNDRSKPPNKTTDVSSVDKKPEAIQRNRSQSQDSKTSTNCGDTKSDSTSVKKTLDSQKIKEPVTSSNTNSKIPSQSVSRLTHVKTEVKVAAKQDLTEKKTEGAPVDNEEKPVIVKSEPKKEIKEETQTPVQTPADIAVPVHPLPRNTSEQSESYLFNALRQSTRCRLVNGGDDTAPAILPYDSEQSTSITWGMRIYPFFGKDLALKEMVKIVNIADHFAVFVLFGKLPKCGDISLLLHHHNDVKTILAKLFHTEMTSTDLNIFVNRRKDNGTYETGELKLNLTDSVKLDTSLAYKMGPEGEGSN